MIRIITVISLVFLAGCTTKYGGMGLMGGVVGKKIQDGVYLVAVSGNSYTSLLRVQQMAALKSAELTLENGYQYFFTLPDNPSALNAMKEKKLRQFALKTGPVGASAMSTIKHAPKQMVSMNGITIPVGRKAGGSILVIMLKANSPHAKKAASASKVLAELKPILVPKPIQSKKKI